MTDVKEVMGESDAIKELRGNYKRRANELAEAILALCDAQGCKSERVLRAHKPRRR